MEKAKNNEMEEMNLRRLSIKMSIPMVISMLSLALYNLVDSIFVANIGTEALTAIALSYPIQAIITAIALGTGIGINSLISRRLGEKQEKAVENIIIHGFLIMILVCIAVAIFAGAFADKIFMFFTQDQLIIEYGAQYLLICLVFSIGLLFQILFEKILEAHGKTTSSMAIQISGAIINLILDPILIYGLLGMPALGIKGAAIATVIGQISGMILGFILLRKHCTKINIKNFKYDIKIIKDIYIVGLPSIFSESMAAFVTLILNKLLISFSDFAVPFWGIYNKVQSFIFMIVYGFNYGMIPIVGYNYGAKKYDRMKQTIKIFIVYAEAIMIIGVVLLIFFGNIIFRIYGAEKGIINIGINGLRILSLGFVFAGISLVLSSVFQAIGKGIFSLIIFMLRQLVINIPLIYLLQNHASINTIWYVFVLSEIIAMTVSCILYKNVSKKIYLL